MKPQYIYKVCAVTVTSGGERQLRSLIAPPPFRLVYELGKKTKPEIGKLLAFKTLSFASQWAANFTEPMALLRGQTGQILPAPPEILDILCSNFWPAFWKGKLPPDIDIEPSLRLLPPAGTILCNWFKPTKLLEFRKL